MRVTLCEDCFPGWRTVEVFRVVPIVACAQCGALDRFRLNYFPRDPRNTALSDPNAECDALQRAWASALPEIVQKMVAQFPSRIEYLLVREGLRCNIISYGLDGKVGIDLDHRTGPLHVIGVDPWLHLTPMPDFKRTLVAFAPLSDLKIGELWVQQ